MSLAGGSYLGLSDSEAAAGPGSKRDPPSVAMPNVLDQCYVQKNPNRPLQKWPNAGKTTQLTNGKKEGNGVDESGIDKPPEPCIVLYKKRLDFTPPQNKTVGCGLLNIGNTCYINSTLQCLLYLPPWYNYVTKEHQQECKISTADCVVCMFHRFLKGALNYHGSPFAPREIVDKLKYFCCNMVRGRQEDAHEFLVSFVDCMQMSLLKGISNKLVDTRSQYTTAVHKVFGIVVRSQIRCKACGSSSNNDESGLNLILGIKNARSLVSAFKLYTKKELMDGANAYSCERCRQRQPAEKHLSVHKAPNVLIIQMLRYDQNEYGSTKLTHHVEFSESLDLGPFMSETDRQSNHHVYQLHGVLVHTGMSIQSGHYFAYVRGMDRKWYKMNDERVHEVSFEEVTTTQAYILFYVRKPQLNPPAPNPTIVKHRPVFTPTLASNANRSGHKPGFSNGNTKTDLSGPPSKPLSAVSTNGGTSKPSLNGSGDAAPPTAANSNSARCHKPGFSNGNTKTDSRSGLPSKPLSAVNTNGGTPKPSLNGSGDAAPPTAVNSNSARCSTTSLGASSIVNRGTKESSSKVREKVAFKISCSKNRWNNTNGNASKPSAPAAESKMPLASSSVSNLPLVTGKTTKLVAYDDESSDSCSDNSVEPVCGVAVPDKSGADLSGCAVVVKAEIATTEINETTTSGIASTETGKSPLGMQTSNTLDLEMFASKHVAGNKPGLKRSSSDSDIRSRLSSVPAAPTISRNSGRRLSSGDGTPELNNGKQIFAKGLELHAKPVINGTNEPADVASNEPPSSLETLNEGVLATPPESGINVNSNHAGGLPENGHTLTDADVESDLPVAQAVVEVPVTTPLIATDASPLAGHSKKRRRSEETESTNSGKRSCRASDGSSADESFEYVWVEKTLDSGHLPDGTGDNHRGMASMEDATAEKLSCSSSREKQLKRMKVHSKSRSRSVESPVPNHSSRSSSSSHRQEAGEQKSHSNHRTQNGRTCDRERKRSRSTLRSSKPDGSRHQSGSSGRDQNSRSRRSRSSHRSAKRDDRIHRSRSSHRSNQRYDRWRRSRSSRRNQRRSRSPRRSIDRGERRRSRTPHGKYSSQRDRRRSRSSSSRTNSNVGSSRYYNLYARNNREHCSRKSSR